MRIDRMKLTQQMVKNGMTTTKLAEECGVSRQTLCYIRNGKSCSDFTGVKIANALGVEVDDLLED